MVIFYTDNAASVQPPPAVGGNILIKGIMLYVSSFAIVRLIVLTRPNPDMSRSRARGRSDSAHECRRRIKIVKFLGLIAKRSVPDSSYSPLHTTDETGLQYHLPARLLACRSARFGTGSPSKRRRRREHGRGTLFCRCDASLSKWRWTKSSHCQS